MLARRLGKKSTASVAIPEDGEDEDGVDLDKRFGFSKELTSRLEVGDEVGRGHFGYTCSAVFKKGEFKGQQVAVKVIPKAKVGAFVTSHPLLYIKNALICLGLDFQALICFIFRIKFCSFFHSST